MNAFFKHTSMVNNRTAVDNTTTTSMVTGVDYGT